MTLKHTLTTRFLHWITALLVIALFVSGWFMVDLDYYSNWYQTLPELHIAGGVVLLMLWLVVLLRLLVAKNNSFPQPQKAIERFAAKWVKRLFYLLVVLMVSTGYLVATGQGEALQLFETIKLPALSHFSASQIDTMGWIHEYTSYLLMVLVLFHASGALKHHFIDKDDTLKRML
jgi:cytochrome b561